MSADGPLVSAVIPVHNCERFVAAAIESVLGQTHRPLECIVVNDGSTDGTADVLGAFGARIMCLTTPRRGVGAARNAGAAAARGEYLAFLDADDLWEPAKIERQLELFAERGELGLVYSGLSSIDEHGRALGASRAPEPGAVLRNTLLNEPPFVSLAQTGVIPRWAFVSSGGFDEAMVNSEDSDLTWRLAARFPIGAVPAPLASYRRHQDQKHLDLGGFEAGSRTLLGKAFGSGLLPPEIQRLERRAYGNLAFTLAYGYRHSDRSRALANLCRALWLSPVRSIRRLARGRRG